MRRGASAGKNVCGAISNTNVKVNRPQKGTAPPWRVGSRTPMRSG